MMKKLITILAVAVITVSAFAWTEIDHTVNKMESDGVEKTYSRIYYYRGTDDVKEEFRGKPGIFYKYVKLPIENNRIYKGIDDSGTVYFQGVEGDVVIYKNGNPASWNRFGHIYGKPEENGYDNFAKFGFIAKKMPSVQIYVFEDGTCYTEANWKNLQSLGVEVADLEKMYGKFLGQQKAYEFAGNYSIDVDGFALIVTRDEVWVVTDSDEYYNKFTEARNRKIEENRKQIEEFLKN